MPYIPRELEYDLFVSYARADNEAENAGKVSALLKAVADSYQRKHKARLRIFFDETPALDSDDRQESVLRALNRSTTLLAILSPAYFSSPRCKREWECHLQCARENGLADDQIIAVSLFDHSALEQVDTHQANADWIECLKRAPIVDCRTIWCDSKPPAESPEIQRTIGQIADAIFDCLSLIPDRLTPLIPPDNRSESQRKLDRVKKPRVHITYDPDISDADVVKDSDLEEPVLDRPTACSMPSDEQRTPGVVTESERAAQTIEPIEINDNVQFTVFRPRAVPPSQWRTLLAFAHLAELPPDADVNEPDPLEEVERQAKQVLGPDFQAYGKTTQDSTSAVPRQGQIVFIPAMEGIEFNPPRYEFQWIENVHKAEFRFRAAPQLEGKTARGRLTVFLGSLILAEITLQFRVDSRAAAADSKPEERASARPYRNIFASYSHTDVAIVRQFEHHAKALGDRYLRDVVDLRAGQVWNDELMRLIEEANVFQLFWSHNAMRSQFVRQEWEFALSLRRPEFIRPTYWETPFPEAPETGLPPAHLRRIHFHFIGTEPHKKVRSDANIPVLNPQPEPPAAHDSVAVPAPHAPPPVSSGSRRRRPRPAIWLGTATAFVLLAAAGLWSVKSDRRPEPGATSAPPSAIARNDPPMPPKNDPAPTNQAPTGPLPTSAAPDEVNAVYDGPPELMWGAFRDMGTSALKEGNLVEARSWFKQCLKIAQEKAQAHPNDFEAQRNLLTSLENLAGLALREGKLEEARGHLQQDLAIQQRPAFNETRLSDLAQTVLEAKAKSQLSQALQQGDSLLKQGKTEKARRSFQNYLETAAHLAKMQAPPPNGGKVSPAPSGR